MQPTHVWVFDPSRRIYRERTAAERAAGQLWASGGPIWREHWIRRTVTGQTRLSWVLEGGEKVRKDAHGVVTSEAALDDRCYLHDHRHQIAEAVRDLRDADTLRAVAALVAYTPATGKDTP